MFLASEPEVAEYIRDVNREKCRGWEVEGPEMGLFYIGRNGGGTEANKAEDIEKVRSMNAVGREQHAVTPDSFPSLTQSTRWAQKCGTSRWTCARLPALVASASCTWADEDAEVPSASWPAQNSFNFPTAWAEVTQRICSAGLQMSKIKKGSRWYLSCPGCPLAVVLPPSVSPSLNPSMTKNYKKKKKKKTGQRSIRKKNSELTALLLQS